jgi:hypothetical protein
MSSQCSGNINNSRIFAYNFNEKLENNYFFINVSNRCVCLICNSCVAVSKKCNVDRHFMTTHKDYISKYHNNEILRKKFEDLKLNCGK